MTEIPNRPEPPKPVSVKENIGSGWIVLEEETRFDRFLEYMVLILIVGLLLPGILGVIGVVILKLMGAI